MASLPENHLSPGQPAIKLREDLFAAKNSSDLLTEMLSSITLADAADVKQVGLGSTQSEQLFLETTFCSNVDCPSLSSHCCRLLPLLCSRCMMVQPHAVNLFFCSLTSAMLQTLVEHCKTARALRTVYHHSDNQLPNSYPSSFSTKCQDHVSELAGQCEAMLPRLAALAEQVSDEANLKQTLAVHGDMEDALVKYRGLLEVRCLFVRDSVAQKCIWHSFGPENTAAHTPVLAHPLADSCCAWDLTATG